MKNSKTLFNDLAASITVTDDNEERMAMASRIAEHVFGLTHSDIMAGKEVVLQKPKLAAAKSIIDRLNASEPLQYILGTADFYGRIFHVRPGVLIPRPETELIVLSVTQASARFPSPRILDIGTGSGCLAITLFLEMRHASVDATDISMEALAIAKTNAANLRADVGFMHHNILKQPLPYGAYDVIVSNPPYVTESERAAMKKNVLDHEPELALFVPDNDPLVYYHAIADHAEKALRPGGLITVEINERFGREVLTLFADKAFTDVRIIKDFGSKDRLITGFRSI
jgi:release factor glutamine methyltransferase